MPDRNDSWKEPSVLRLIQAGAETDPVRIIERYASRLLDEARQSSLPVDVEGIASLLGLKVRVTPLPFAGRVYMDMSDSLVLDLNASDPVERRRFTCAHEIMHTAFPGFRRHGSYRMDRSVAMHALTRGEEEYLCDHGAAALLMPSRVIQGYFDAGRGVRDIERLAKAARVSLEAAGIRLTMLASVPTIFVVLERMSEPTVTSGASGTGAVDLGLRVRYSYAMGTDWRVPRFSRVPRDSVYAEALSRLVPVRGIGGLPGRPAGRRVLAEAKAYPDPGRVEGRRVLALLRPVA